MAQQTKYSLKTRQFTKRKHPIFKKEKSYGSLEIHEPKSELNILNDSQNQFSKLSFNNSEQNLHQTTKIKYPYSEQYQNQPTTILNQIKMVILQNQQKINNMNNITAKIYRGVMEQYERHAAQLTENVNRKCNDFCGLLRKAFKLVEKKEQDIANMDKRIWVFENTMRECRQTFRIIQIKQDCLEAQIENNSMARNHYQKAQSLVRLADDSISQIGYGEDIEPTQRNINNNQANNQKNSPFEANQLLKIKETIPYAKNSHEWQQKHANQYSFNRLKEINQQNSAITKKPNSYNSIYVEEQEESYADVQLSEVGRILLQQEKYSLWIDALDCVRRKNGSYVLNSEGEPIMNNCKTNRVLHEENLLERC